MFKLPLRTVYCQPMFVMPTDTHQFLDLTSFHPYHCKKGIPYSQTFRLNRISSDNSNFDKRCNELESWLFEKGYSEKMVRKQVLRAREHSRESLLEKVDLGIQFFNHFNFYFCSCFLLLLFFASVK